LFAGKFTALRRAANPTKADWVAYGRDLEARISK
jgi:hypothetical protein